MKRTDLEQIYDRNFRTVWNICYPYFMNPQDTEDAVQETFYRLMLCTREFRDPDHEKAWLIRAARNVCKDELKRARRRDVPLEQAEEISTAQREPDETLAALQSLPEKYRTVLYLYYYENCSVARMAKMLGRLESTLRSDMRRGRMLLKERMRGEEYEKSNQGRL